MFSKLQLSCRVTPSDRRPPVRPAWTEDSPRQSPDLSGATTQDKGKETSALTQDKGQETGAHTQDKGKIIVSYSLSPFTYSWDSFDFVCNRVSFLSEGLSISECPSSSSSTAAFPSSLSSRFSPGASWNTSSHSSLSQPSLQSSSSSTSSHSDSSWSVECSLDSSTTCSELTTSSCSASSASVPSIAKENPVKYTPTNAALSATTNSITDTASAQDLGESSYTLVFAQLSAKDLRQTLNPQSPVRFETAFDDNRFNNRSVSHADSVKQNRLCLQRRGWISINAGCGVRDRFGVQGLCQNNTFSFRRDTPPSPSGESDSDAQIDSMSSSDLEHCEDLQTFELAQASPDIANHHSHDGDQLPPSRRDKLGNCFSGQSDTSNDNHVMSFREFEQLPPLSEDCAELPAMWEDGGGLGVGSVRDGFSIGRNVADEALAQEGQWSVLKDSVQIFTEPESLDDDGSANNNTQETLEQRNNLIEQTLSEIYESPFPHLIYAPVQQSSQPKTKPSSQRKTSFKLPGDRDHNQDNDDDEDSSRDRRKRVGFSSRVDDNTNDNVVDNNDKSAEEEDDQEEESAEDQIVRQKQLLKPVRSDIHSSVKASIARAAQRAVSGYRSCDDADNYVGARFKPTLILARAPPSPSGILRRTNKKASAKVSHGNVRWADGRAPTFPPSDEAT